MNPTIYSSRDDSRQTTTSSKEDQDFILVGLEGFGFFERLQRVRRIDSKKYCQQLDTVLQNHPELIIGKEAVFDSDTGRPHRSILVRQKRIEAWMECVAPSNKLA